MNSMLNTHLYGKIYAHISKAASRTGTTSRVMLIQQRIQPTPVYHVGLLVEERGYSKIFEHGPVQYDRFRDVDGIIVPLPPIRQSIREIEDFESTLPTEYLLGIRDCRHHVLDLLHYIYPPNPP